MVCIGVYLIRSVYLKSYNKEYIKILCLVIVFGLLGGKISSILSLYSQGKGTFIECVVYSGNIYYGCMISGAIALLILSKHYKIHWLSIFDICASILPLGQAIGRFGCFLNGCCYGINYNGPLTVLYPINNQHISVFPTWFCESFFCFLLFISYSLLK